MPTLPAWPYPRTIAHRGAGRLAPENTLAAFRLGAAHGYRAFEFDVKLSRDGHSFLLHDDTLERTSNGHGPADALTLAELQRLDAGAWHSPAYAGETMPALATIAAYTRANDFCVNVEIKPMPGREAETGHAVARDVRRLWQGTRIPPLLSSFSEEALATAAQTAPALPRALLLDHLPEDWPARLRRLGCIALDANHDCLDADIIACAHANSFRVLCYTPNDPVRVKTLFSWGIDSVITDEVGLISPV
ncbi:MAG: glycerophosphodiester phosphodiesterase [Candidatus Dactylopiibacterium carminicum]|uniref:Glycerophosphodiester phosphodiesterase n=1 Tax=Candidatus Dactylopiibacterium carminicum TaxID=857335 RepID=A0A272EYK9_9RHOO|nr:glycerophosphodiester phosphodiesterase [Candidatus Dactylopiibacterium carminicum]KAF7600650.1 glycerophosphodiester phosphodiesterase [Candidatus Dactylopiibacterium carminicum]PAS95116.1 MAG: glycerophosphodiester phosphodiesterase [Candidatus Dactylopiibacterium carminicum]PAS97920.1 MAG: glycerophosphodiester phosphodiesterase [Candidatus Dactylopiibacterium carminicum]PAT00647.1 MAG: glycerophosphodiester phosphodiesterase [Candidatus Dactylopiibacterium carminicum]